MESIKEINSFFNTLKIGDIKNSERTFNELDFSIFLENKDIILNRILNLLDLKLTDEIKLLFSNKQFSLNFNSFLLFRKICILGIEELVSFFCEKKLINYYQDQEILKTIEIIIDNDQLEITKYLLKEKYINENEYKIKVIKNTFNLYTKQYQENIKKKLYNNQSFLFLMRNPKINKRTKDYINTSEDRLINDFNLLLIDVYKDKIKNF